MPDRAEMRLARQASVYLAQDSAEARLRARSLFWIRPSSGISCPYRDT
jgi:hypothetical protein